MADHVEIIEQTTIIEVDETHVEVVTVGTQGPPGASTESAVQVGDIESALLLVGEHEANTLAPEGGAGFSGGGASLAIKGGRGIDGDQFGGSLTLQGGQGIGAGNAGGLNIFGGNAEEGGYPGNVTIAAGSNGEFERGEVAIQDLKDPTTPTDAANKRYMDASDALSRDRANHTGSQAISTVTGLQNALDEKISKEAAIALSIAL